MAQIKLNATYGLTGALPAVSGANLTSLTSGNLTGALPAISGASLTTLNASNVSSGTLNAARYSGGKVLQVVTAVLTADVSFGSGVGSWTEIKAVDITPSATSSKIFIIWSFLGNIGNGNYPGLKTRLLRDTTEIRGQTRLESYWGEGSVTASINKRAYLSGNWLDSPSTTSAITYTMEGDNESGSSVSGTYQGAIKTANGADSSITVMEIA